MDRDIYSPDNVIAVMHFDAARRRLVAGSYQLRPWRVEDTAAIQGQGHWQPVQCVVVNPTFHEVRRVVEAAGDWLHSVSNGWGMADQPT